MPLSPSLITSKSSSARWNSCRKGRSERSSLPDVRLNYGFLDRWEVTWEGMWAHGLSAETGRASLVGNDILVKTVLREGTLQDKAGPSIAIEFGPLLPGINGEDGTGATFTAIVSQQWSWMIVHFNVEPTLTRDQHAELFLDTIIEGPHEWTVRPVAELFYDRVFGLARETSGLIGAIWQIRENVALDVAFRAARVNDRTAIQVLAGVTFSLRIR